MMQFLFSDRIALRSPVFARDDALAHDAWADFDSDMTTLEATVIDNNVSGADSTLQVRASDGFNWTIELGSHARNDDAGLTANAVSPGDRITVVGMQTHHFGESRIKAAQLIVAGHSFDLYPELLVES